MAAPVKSRLIIPTTSAGFSAFVALDQSAEGLPATAEDSARESVATVFGVLEYKHADETFDTT